MYTFCLWMQISYLSAYLLQFYPFFKYRVHTIKNNMNGSYTKSFYRQ